MAVALPQGRLNTLLVWWINEGWHRLGKSVPGGRRRSFNLFTSSVTNAFTDSTFCQYWKKIMLSVGADYFPPNLARTSFVEAYTSVMDQSLWQGAASVMGNSPRQWAASYNPSSTNRSIQGAVVEHSTFQERIREGTTGPHRSSPGTAPQQVVSRTINQDRQVTITEPVLPVLPFPSDDMMPLPFTNHPQPGIGEVESIFMQSSSGRKKKRGRDVASSPQWGGAWSGW